MNITSLFKTIRFITHHPLNKHQKSLAVRRWLKWQVGSRLVPGPVVVNFVNDAKLLVSPGMAGATGNIYTGLHEFEDMSFVLHFLQKDDLFIDVGANIGSYTVLASAAIGATSIAIEPLPSTFKHLMQNLYLNNLNQLVTAWNLGVGSQPGVLQFTADLDTVNHVVSDREKSSINTISIKMDTLDNVVAEPSPNLLKIDVEGFETPVIAGADHVLSQDSLEAVIMELNGSGSRYGFDEMALHRKMLEYGFNTFTYSPFDRTLTPLDGKNLQSGNTLYLRNIERVSERLAMAPPFRVNGMEL
jgi:FkbM family methyltransferase